MTEAVSTYNWDFLKQVYAKTCDENEFQIFKHLTESYNLDPMSKEIWCIKSGNSPARIFVSRDGHLAIAHRSGHWGSIKTIFDWGEERQYVEIKDRYTGKVTGRVLVPFSATTIIWRNDSNTPTEHTVFWDEYGSNQSLWLSKPKTMLQKVAECQCLRRAYDMHGFYSSEEFDITGETSTPAPAIVIPATIAKPVPDIPKVDSTENKQVELESKKETPKETPKKESPKKVEKKEDFPFIEEYDYTRTRKTTPGLYDYDEKQIADTIALYDEYDLDKTVFEKAKIDKNHWDKDLVIYDYKKQMKAKGLLNGV